jgi:AbrB family looped-hinge helix DNA binding protein
MTSFRTVISSRGQVVIPSALRRQFGLEKGTRATWSREGGRLILTPITMRRIDEIIGFLKPKPGEPSLAEDLRADREKERERDLRRRQS